MPLLDDAVGDQRQSYLLLFGAVGCVLLIACANIANLLLARFAGRRKEIAARFALGASRADVVRQLVTESMVVAGLGGALGVVLAQWTLRGLVAFGADLIPRALEIAIDPLALGFALVVTLGTGLAIGLLPALQAARVNVQEALKDASRGSTGGGRRLRAGLLVAEVSLSLVLLIAAGLLVTSFARLQAVQPGFQPDGVFTAQLALPPQRYAGDALVAFYERFFERLATLPGGIGGGAHRPGAAHRRADAGAGGRRRPATAADERTPAGEPPPGVAALLRDAGHPAARRPRFRRARQRPDAARRHHQRDLRPAPLPRRGSPRPHPGHRHGPAAGADRRRGGRRAQHRPEHAAGRRLLPAGPAAARRRSPTSWCAPPSRRRRWRRSCATRCAPWTPICRCCNRRRSARASPRPWPTGSLALVLLAGLAGLALVLACLGVYSVMAHLVAFRTCEIGIRMALGATPTAVMRLVLGHGSKLTLLGIGLGLAGALAVSRLMQQTLFEVDPADPFIYGGLSLVLLLVAESASWFPARRATRIDPLIALRGE